MQPLELASDWYKNCVTKDDLMDIDIVENHRDWDFRRQTSEYNLSEAELTDKIQKLQSLLPNCKLPDKGKKLQDHIHHLEDILKSKSNKQKNHENLQELPNSEYRNHHQTFYSPGTEKRCPVQSNAQSSCKKVSKNNADGERNAFHDDLKIFKSSHRQHSPERRDAHYTFTARQVSCSSFLDCPSKSRKVGESSSKSSKGNSNSESSFSTPTLEGGSGKCQSAAKRLANRSCTPTSMTKKLFTSPESFSKDKASQVIVVVDEEDEMPNKQGVVRYMRRKDMRIYYPERDHPECVEICLTDLECLKPRQYLSSAIINFYMQYLQNEKFKSEQIIDFHFFNTYFYNKLVEALYAQDNDEALAKLRRWLKGVNIFKKSYIFMPIHDWQHWSLAIISIPSKECKGSPIILHLDSLGLHDSKVIFAHIRSYLRTEWKFCLADLTEVPISETIWKNFPDNIHDKQIEVPQQENDYDCGLFVLLFMERFIHEAPPRLQRTDLDKFGRKWFRPAEASQLRTTIKCLLENFFKKASQTNQTTVDVEDLH